MQIKYEITDTILNNIIQYELAVQKISQIKLPYKYQTQLYQKIKADEISHLSDLLGISIGYEKAMQIQLGKETFLSIEKHKILNNYRSIQEFIKSYNDRQFLPISNQLIQHLNVLALKNIIEDWESGKFRSFSEKPNPIYDNWSSLKEYYPTINMESHFDLLTRRIGNRKDLTHKIIISFILFYEMIDKAPLSAGNQLTAITFLSAVLKNYDYNPENLLPIAKIINENEQDIVTEFKKSRTIKNLTSFIEFMSSIFTNEIASLHTQILFSYENNAKKKIALSIEYNDRQIKILEYLQIHPYVSRNEYSKIMGISFMTSFRDLQKLLDDGYLAIEGKGRGTKYSLKKDLSEEKSKSIPTIIDSSLIQ